MGIGYIIAGMFFLFEPFIGVADILPDFIGYLLILHGMSKIADLEIKISEAKMKMQSALYVSLGRFAVYVFSFLADFDDTLKLVFVFAFAVLDVFFVLPAFSSLFNGLDYARMRFTSVANSPKLSDAGKLSAIFLIVRAVGAVVPELTSLSTDYGYVQSGGGGLEGNGVIRIMLIMVCAAVVLLFGIVWLSAVCGAISELRKDKEFVSVIEKKYAAEIMTDKTLAMRRSVKNFWRIWFAAFFFLFCISIDYYYIIPEFVFGICAFFAFRGAGKYESEPKKIGALCLCSSGIMATSYVLLFRYSARMESDLFPYQNDDFLQYYLPYIIFAVAGYAVMIFICKRANSVMKKMTQDCIGLRGSSDARRREIDEDMRTNICARIDRLFVIECVSVVLGAVLTALIPWFSLAWAVKSLLNIIVVVYMYSVMSDVFAEAEKVL